MKITILIILLVLFPLEGWGACTGATPIWNCSNDVASISACIAGTGCSGFQPVDTINVSATGSPVTWASGLSITRGVKLVGPGSSNLTIKCASENVDLITYTPGAFDETFEVSGFTFDSNTTAGRAILINNASSTTEITKVRIYSNSFINSVYSVGKGYGENIRVEGNIWGVIHNNTFSGNADGVIRFHGASSGAVTGLGSWDTQLATPLGTAKAIYVEDNTFTGNSYFFYNEHGARSVVRYNDIHYTTGNYEFIYDMHPSLADNCGTMIGEFYGNDLTLDEGLQTFAQRAGQAVIAWNKATTAAGTWTQYSDAGWDDSDCTTTNPIARQPRGWMVNTRFGANVIPFEEGVDPQNFIDSDISFFTFVEAGYDGSTGTGCGNAELSSFSPTLTNTGYFKTAFSCASISATNIGINATPIRGTLYVWNGASWDAKWTPLDYPHPLRGIRPPDGVHVITPVTPMTPHR